MPAYKVVETTLRLGDDMDTDTLPDSCKAPLFAKMVQLSTDVIEHYHGDLYHDAVWLNENTFVDGGGFFWAPYESGTHLWVNEAHTAYPALVHDKYYKITFRHPSRFVWKAEITYFTDGVVILACKEGCADSDWGAIVRGKNFITEKCPHGNTRTRFIGGHK